MTDSVLLPGRPGGGPGARVDGSIVGPGATVGQRCVVTGDLGHRRRAVIASGTSLDGERYPSGN